MFFFFSISNFRNTRILRKAPYGLGKVSDGLANDSDGLGNVPGGLGKVYTKIKHVNIILLYYFPLKSRKRGLKSWRRSRRGRRRKRRKSGWRGKKLLHTGDKESLDLCG